MSGGSQSEGASNSASPASSVALSNPGSSQGINNNAPKYGTVVPNRIFVGGISSNTTEAELSQLFSKYGNVKATKIIADRAGVSKGYGFVTFESDDEVQFLIKDANNIVLKERRLNIAPAVKKQPFSRSFDASSPPPSTPTLYYHNGTPYLYHNGMAFYNQPAHHPPIATLPPADPSMYSSYGPAHAPAPATYQPVLVPAAPPVYMPQNYSYQPMPMTNGAATQFIYPGSTPSTSGSGSPLAGTPDSPHLPPPMHPQFFTQFGAQESFYPQPFYITSYAPYNPGEYDMQDHQIVNDDRSSSGASTPRSDISDRSSIRSPVAAPARYAVADHTGPSPDTQAQTSANQPSQCHTDSQVPVVSWQNLKNNAEERELYIRDGRRAFHPIVPPPPPPPQVLVYPPGPFSPYQQPKHPQMADNSRGLRQVQRGRWRYNNSANCVPFIPKFPDSFNNNNPLALNNNFHDKKPAEMNNTRGRLPHNMGRGAGRPGHHLSPTPSKPKSINSYVSSSPSPQMQPAPERQYDRSIVYSANTAPRWAANPPVTSNQIKRFVASKKQNGSTHNVGMSSNTGGVRMLKNTQEASEEEDLGGGGDAPPPQLALTPPSTPSSGGNLTDITSKIQAMSLSSS